MAGEGDRIERDEGLEGGMGGRRWEEKKGEVGRIKWTFH